MTDLDAVALPVQLDPETILRLQVSTWQTDGGDFDVVVDIPSSDGARRSYEDLLSCSEEVPDAGVVVRVASLEDIGRSKRTAGREKDLDAFRELDEILALQRRRDAPDGGWERPQERRRRHGCGQAHRRDRTGVTLGSDAAPP